MGAIAEDLAAEITPPLERFDATLRCRRVHLNQALANILLSSLEAVSELPEKWVLLEVEECVNRVYFKILNSGRGVGAEVRDRFFEPSFATKPGGPGTGLGLPMARRLIEEQDGSI